MLDGNLEIVDKDKVILCDKIPTSNYSKMLYDIIKDMKKEKNIFKIHINIYLC